MTSLPTQSPELLLERVLQTSLDAIVLCRAIRNEAAEIIDFQVIQCNERAAVMTGITRQMMLSRSMLTLDPDGLNSGIFDKYRQVVETGLPMYVEHYFAGGDVWMAQSLARFDDGVLTSWSDISALKRSELDRRREADLLEAILDNTQTGIAVMKSVRSESGQITDFRFTHLNADAERITRRRKHELIDHLYSEAWPEARTNGVLDWHIHVAKTGEPAKINGVNLPVGEYNGWYNIRIRPFGDGVIATFVDVTALKLAELANQQQADLLRSVLDSSSNAIIAFNAVRDPQTHAIRDFRYVAHNEANRRNMNASDEAILGHTLLEFFPFMDEAGLFERFAAVVESGQGTQFEQEFTEGGWNGWFEISAIKWGDGMVLTLADITVSKAYQQQIEQTNRDLLNANDNLRQFAYVASHDLQEPLRKIMAFGNMLQEQCALQLDEAGNDIIRRMQSATERMSELIKDVLAYSRITTQRQTFQPVSLGQVLAEVRYDLAVDSQTTQCVFETDALPTVKGDRAQLRQLFSNLLANALKFRPTDRPVIIRMGCRTIKGADGPAELKPTASYYEVSIEDNGIGFDSKYADRIFQVFQRLHTRQQYGGTGVGLAICKRIVENHHGVITASSQPGLGATFRVYLPV